MLSRSITSFSQFLPLPISVKVKGSDIMTLNLHYNQGHPPPLAFRSRTLLSSLSFALSLFEHIQKCTHMRIHAPYIQSDFSPFLSLAESLYVYTHVYIYIHTCMYKYISIYVHITYLSVHIHVFKRACMCKRRDMTDSNA